jgi:hypothetical protein
MIWIGIAALALVGGVWVGLGHPGLKGRDDRVVGTGRPQRLERKRIDLLRPVDRGRRQRGG